MGAKRIVLAEYFTTDDTTLLFVVRDDFLEPKVHEIRTPLNALRQFVSRFGLLTHKGEMSDLSEWQQLMAPFVEPVLAWVDVGDIIWFVPHDVLHYLPLHALKVGAEQQYLIERNPICYTPSASVMRFCQKKRTGRREKALVLGDSRNNLLFAYEEAFTVAELFQTQPYVREQATKTLVQAKLRDERDALDVLHFSCHGRFDTQQALKSGIELAPEGNDIAKEGNEESEEQWNLTTEEIFRLSMHATLVILSACETGVNEHKPGDELIGLTRALIYAGTPSVVVSLWSVASNSTSMLMEHFYQQLLAPIADHTMKQPMTKVEALQIAQLFVKKLTAEDLLTYCDQHLEKLQDASDRERTISFLLGRGYAQREAQDVHAALDTYRNVRVQLDACTGDWTRSIIVATEQTIDLLESYIEGHDEQPFADYNVKPFEHPYHWAPFILVGDWQ
jgi:CHAT domain-containing protein